MKKNMLLFILCFTTLTTLQAQEWLTNMEDAKTRAALEEKAIVLVFQGSDWCAPCIKLNKEIFESETFQLYAKTHFIMVQADFPRRKKNALTPKLQEHNNALAERYNKRGVFPFVVVLNEGGTVLGETSYLKITPEKYILELEKITK
jgi:thioredoxin-related protein